MSYGKLRIQFWELVLSNEKKKRLNIRTKKYAFCSRNVPFIYALWTRSELDLILFKFFPFVFYFAIEKKPMSNLNLKYRCNVLGIHWIAIWRCFNNPAELYLNYSIYRKCRNNRQNNPKRQRTRWNSFLSWYCCLFCEIRAWNNGICYSHHSLLSIWRKRLEKLDFRQKFSAIPVYNGTTVWYDKISENTLRSCILSFFRLDFKFPCVECNWYS